MNQEDQPPKGGGRRRADVPADSPSTVEMAAISRHQLEELNAEPVAEKAEEPGLVPTTEATAETEAAGAQRPEGEVDSAPVADSEAGAVGANAAGTAQPAEGRNAALDAALDAAPPSDRRRRARINPVLLLGFLLPLLTIGALFLVQPAEPGAIAQAPTSSPLTRTWLICPPAGQEAQTWVATAATDATGEVVGQDPVPVAGGAVAKAQGPVLQGKDGTAPGLTAVQISGAGASTCPQPQFDQWFTGVGAGAEHRSTLSLVNPDAGTAVADISVYGRSGVLLDAKDLRGLSVSGRDTLTVALDERIPVDEELTLHIAVQRGRLGVFMDDSFTPVGAKKTVRNWAQAQSAPATETRLVGLGSGAGKHVLTVANGGQATARVSLQVMTDDSEFTPTDLDDVSVPAGQVRTIDLTKVLADAVSARGVVLRSTAPVVSSLRFVGEKELVWAAPVVGLTSPGGQTLPTGPQRLVLSGATRSGEVTLSLQAQDGSALETRTVTVSPGRTTTVALPDRARWLGLDPHATTVGAVVELRAETPNHSALPIAPLVTDDFLPAVRQALS